MNLTLPPTLRIIDIDGADLFEAFLNGSPLEVHNEGDVFDERFATLMPPNLDLCFLRSQNKLVIRKLGREYYTLDFINVSFAETLYLNDKGARIDLKTKKKPERFAKRYSPSQIREHLYLEGFVFNDKTYVRYKRSSGAAKQGSCLFVRKDRLSILDEWSNAGLSEEDLCFQNLTSYEAYRALSLSSLILALDIRPKNILFVKDAKVVLKDQDVISVNYEGGKLVAKPGKSDITNNIFDGEGLLDESVFLSHGLADKGMMLLRSRFFKCCAFNAKLKRWFADNGVTKLSQLTGITTAESLDDILLVASESCLKYLKLASGGFCQGNIVRWCAEVDKDEIKFGVVKTDKPTRFFGGDMVETTYQLLNTLQLSSGDMRTLITPQIEYIERIRDIGEKPEFIRFFLEGEDGAHEHEDEGREDFEDADESVSAQDDAKYSAYTFKNKICLELVRVDENVKYTNLFKQRVYRSVMDSLYLRLYMGRVLVHGTFATLLGNPYEYLRYILKDEAGKPRFNVEEPTSLLSEGEIYSPFFDEGAELIGSRSPHTTMGNILLARNKKLPEVDRYFNLSRQIVVVDAINNNIQHRLNGCDYDSDFMLLSDNRILVKGAQKHYADFPVPVTGFGYVDNKMEPLARGKKENLIRNLLGIDEKIADNLVGQIINLSQLLNSHLWDRLSKNKRFDFAELYSQIAILSILSGAEIDSAKWKPPFDIQKEYRRIQSYGRKQGYTAKSKRPMFFLALSKQNGRRPSIGKIKQNVANAKGVKTTMDTLWKIINGYSFHDATRLKTVPFFDLFSSQYNTEGFSGPFYQAVKRAAEEITLLSERLRELKTIAKTGDYKMELLRFASLVDQTYQAVKFVINRPEKAKCLLRELCQQEGGFTPSFVLLYLIWLHRQENGYSFSDLLNEDARPMPTLRRTEKGERWEYVLFREYRYSKKTFQKR